MVLLPDDKSEVQTLIDEAIKKAADFSTRKIGDTPTDDNQLSPKGYTDTKIPLGVGTAVGQLISFSAPSVVTMINPGTTGQALLSNGVGSVASFQTLTTTAFDYQAFTTTGSNTWTKPARATANSPVLIQLWAGGGGGATAPATSNVGGGGGGGAYVELWATAGTYGSTVSCSVGVGGAADTAGGNTTWNTGQVTAYGGGAGAASGITAGSGGGGGVLSVGANGSGSTSGAGGNPADGGGFGGGGNGTIAIYGGGGGGNGLNNGPSPATDGGNSIHGGGGGGGGSIGGATGNGGTSAYGGAGGAGGGGSNGPGNNGVAPGGGGGGASHNIGTGSSAGGAGGRGEIRVWTFF